MTRPAVAVLALATLTGCGGVAPGRPATPPAAAAAPSLPRDHELAVRLTGSFRAGLRRLSIAQGVGGGSGDLGQPVATGFFDRATCRGLACRVRWHDVEGRPRTTRYVVHRDPSACFAATAQPRLNSLFDANEGAMVENPLQELFGRC